MEKWREVYTEDQIRKVQEIELQNLEVLKEVCAKLNIRFFAYGGTLIGAVRHKGFIPWDDDLDVAMFREDYVRFIREAPQHLPENYVLQTPYTTPRTPYPYTKLRLKGTKYIEYSTHRLPIEQGIYVDIYPIDDLSDDNVLYYRQYKEYQRLIRLYVWRQCPYLNNERSTAKVRLKKLLRFGLSMVLKLVPQAYLMRRIDAVATRYNGTDTKRKGNLNFPRPVNVFYNVLPLEEGELNGHTIPLPAGWHEHLTSRYGDYRQLPPEEKRLGHKPYLLDFGQY